MKYKIEFTTFADSPEDLHMEITEAFPEAHGVSVEAVGGRKFLTFDGGSLSVEPVDRERGVGDV